MSLFEKKKGAIHIIIITILIIVIGFIAINIWVSSNYLVIKNYTVDILREKQYVLFLFLIYMIINLVLNNKRLVEKIAGFEPNIIWGRGTC